jgi:hypothetical protein
LKLVLADPGQVQLALLRLPALRSFTLHSLCWVQGLGDMLARSRFPALRSLELRLCETFLENNPDDARAYRTIYTHQRERDPIGGGHPTHSHWREELPPVLDMIRTLPLERLALTSWLDVYGVFDTLAAATFPPSLVELDFSDSGFDDVAASRLANLNVMLQLKRLVLAGVPLRQPQLLDGFGVDIVRSHGAGATHRYVVGME